MIHKMFDAIKRTVTNITGADIEEDTMERTPEAYNNQTQNYGTYDLGDLFPYKLFATLSTDTLITVAQKSGATIAQIRELNDLSTNIKDDDELKEAKLVMSEGWCGQHSQILELTVGDMMAFDFQAIAETHKPNTFYVHYATIRGDALGKLILTEYELLFEPLNSKLKGFINQESILKSR